MRLITLIENETARRDLMAEHGLSFLVEADGKQILFDTGSSSYVWKNAEKLGVSPRDIDIVVLSHNHYDHVGGLTQGIRLGMDAEIVCGEEFFDEKYRRREAEGVYTDLGSGLSRRFEKENSSKIQICGEMLQLTEHCFAVGRFKRTNKWEEISNKFLRRTALSMGPDAFEDEICMVIELDGGDSVGVITGCSHPGIINILETVKTRFPGRKLAFAAGGIHLKDAGEEQRRRTIEALRDLKVESLWFNHCSGEFLEEAIAAGKSGISGGRLRSGDCLFFQ